MKNKKFGICLFITMCVALSSTACNIKTDQTAKTPYYSVTIDGEKLYYSHKDESIKQIKEMTEAYVMVSAQSDYQNLDMVDEEFSLFTSEAKEKMESYDWVGAIKEQISHYQLQHVVSEYNITGIQLQSQHGKKKAIVTCDYITSTKHATDEYLETVNIKKGTDYKRTLTLTLELEKGEWKVSDYSTTAREEVL